VMQYSSYMSKTIYAFAVEKGNVIIVENRSMPAFERLLGVPLVMNLTVPKISRQFIYDSVLPTVHELLWNTQNSLDDTSTDEANGADETDSDSTPLPTEIHLYQDGKPLALPIDPEEEIDLPDNVDTAPIKIVLKWAGQTRFQQVNLDSLVDREVNLTTPMKKSYTLNECVDLFTSEEQLAETDSWYCPTCKKHQRAFKKLDLWSLPQILIVQLKRFQYSRYSREKIDTPVVIPIKGLDLTDKLADPSHKMLKYDLIALNNHSGGLGSGHYTAKALNNGHWCEFNDSSAYVSSADLKESFASQEAYILYYRRRAVDAPSEKSGRLSAAASSTRTVSPNSSQNSPVTNGKSPTSASSKRRISESNKMEID